MPKPKIFVSYSHKDVKWMARLKKHLTVLAGEGLLDEWDDERIQAGADWESEIDKAMETADVAALLVSVDFLISPYVTQKEIPRLLARRKKAGLTVVPVIARSCGWRDVKSLSLLQARPRNGKPLAALYGDAVDRELTVIAKELYLLAKEGTRSAPTRGSRGLTQGITKGAGDPPLSPPPASPPSSREGRREPADELESATLGGLRRGGWGVDRDPVRGPASGPVNELDDLEPLPPAASRGLLLSLAPRLGAEAEPVARLCGRLPWALRLVTAALDEDPDLTPQALRERLERPDDRRDVAERVFGVAFELLAEPLRRALLALISFPGDFDLRAATHALARSPEEAEEDLGELARRGLVAAEGGRFRLDDLVRRFAGPAAARARDRLA